MVQYKKETRDSKVYLGYSWKCNSETDPKEIWKVFFEREKEYIEKPFVVATLPDGSGEFTYSICINNYSSDIDSSKYELIELPKGEYIRLLLKGDKQKVVREGVEFVLANFNLSSNEYIEVFDYREIENQDLSMNLIFPIENEKSKSDKLIWKVKKLWEKPWIKFIFISVGVTITGIAAYKFYQDTSDIEVDDRSLITTDDKFEKISTASNDTLDSEHSDEEQLSTSVTRGYTPNTVPAHSQRYHTKQGVKTIMKEPYSRGQSEDFEDDDFHEIDDSESIDVYDAAEIWISNGMDPDYTFGFTEEELKRAME